MGMGVVAAAVFGQLKNLHSELQLRPDYAHYKSMAGALERVSSKITLQQMRLADTSQLVDDIQRGVEATAGQISIKSVEQPAPTLSIE